MENIKITVTDNSAVIAEAPVITSGMVGVVCEFELSEYWDEFDEVIATHRGSGVHLDTAIEDGQTVVPWECLVHPYDTLEIGVFGATSDGERQTPTVWCKVGRITEGAEPATEEGREPSRTVLTQIREDIERLDGEKLSDAPWDGTQYARKDGDWVEVEGGGGGSVDWEDIEGKPSTFPPSSHTHAWTGITDKPTAFPPEAHNHDDRYYTEAEADALLSDKADADDVETLETAVVGLVTDVTAIKGKIPNQATTTNQLADKDFVNSTVGTNTAIFRGTFDSVAELEAYAGEKTNNDYAFVIIYDPVVTTQIIEYDRYKYNGTAWVYEYALNNSSFTAVQWAAINSNITDALTALIGTAVQPEDLADYHDTSKQDVISDLSDIRSGAELGATAVQPATLADYSTTTEVQQMIDDAIGDAADALEGML